MKILYTVDCRLDNGGAPKSTCILANEMAKLHDVSILTPLEPNSDKYTFKVVQLTSYKDSFPFPFLQPFKYIRLIMDVNKVINEVNPDIIHTEMPRVAQAVGILKSLGKCKKPIIYTEREYVSGLRQIYKIMYKYLVAKPFDQIVCLSNKATAFWYKYRKGGVDVIPNPGGAVYDSYSDDEERIAKSRVKDYDRNNLNVLFVGRFIPSKRWDIVDTIIKHYNTNPLAVHFYIAVAFNETDDSARDMIQSLDIFENVTVYANANKQQMSDLYYIADIHMITSAIESFGRTAIEAMSRKCVVYSTDAGAISETIGFPKYILPSNADDFVNVLREYEYNVEMLKAEKEQMFNRYHELYTTESNLNIHISLYERLIIRYQD